MQFGECHKASSIEGPTPMIDEDSPLHSCSVEEAVDTTWATYGARKAECERIAMESGTPTVVLRPSLVYGEHDHTDRFAYWIWRVYQQKPFILPDDGLTVTRRTYAPDLASVFVSTLTGPTISGKAFNIAETDPLTFRDSLFYIGKHLGLDPFQHAISPSTDLLLKEGIKPFVDFPLWIPRANLLIDTFRARRELSFQSTPSAKALADATDAFLSEKREPKAGISTSAERELIAKL
jgi:nucleoside-diphosphate-sugar epimerase